VRACCHSRECEMDIFEAGKWASNRPYFFQLNEKEISCQKCTNGRCKKVENTIVHHCVVFKEPATIVIYLCSTVFNVGQNWTLFTNFNHPHFQAQSLRNYQRLKKTSSQSQQSLGRIVNILDGNHFSGMRVRYQAFAMLNGL